MPQDDKIKFLLEDFKILQENDVISGEELEIILSNLKSQEVKKYLELLAHNSQPEIALKDVFFSTNSFFSKFLFNDNIYPEVRAEKGVIDYLINFENETIKLEIKPLFKAEFNNRRTGKALQKLKKSAIKLDRHMEQIKKYLGLEGEYVILTNLEEWYFFSRNFTLDKDGTYFAKKNIFELIKEFQEYDNFKRYIDRLEEFAYKIPLDETFFESLKEWYENFEKIEFETDNKKKSELIIRLINKFIFIQILDNFLIVNKNFIRETWKYIEKRWKPKGTLIFLEKFLKEINNFFYEYYDTELFKKEECILDFINKEEKNISKFFESLMVVLGVNYGNHYQFKWKRGIIQFNYKKINEDILGKTYETFLAEIRKDKGIYYTPKYVTEYIIENTVNQKFDELINQIKINLEKREFEKCLSLVNKFISIKILDPACGSSSFLIKILKLIWLKYQELIEVLSSEERKHINYENKLILSKEEEKILEQFNELKREFKKDKRNLIAQIILRHIYGVDLDSKALEIGKINIWLEAIRISPNEFKFEKLPKNTNHILPNLEMNFINGNSLIGLPEDVSLDFLEKNHENDIKELFRLRNEYLIDPSNETLIKEINNLKRKIRENLNYRLKQYLEENHISSDIVENTVPLHWQLEFWFAYFDEQGKAKNPSQRGFDVVISNPPYIDYRTVTPSQAHQFFKKQYISCKDNPEKYNIFVPFIEKGLQELKNEGKLGYIIPIHFLSALMSKPLRKEILEKYEIEKIVDLSRFKVFKDANTYPTLIFIKKEAPSNNLIKVSYRVNEEEITENSIPYEEIEQKYFEQRNDKVIFIDNRAETISIIKKIEKKGRTLNQIIELKWGTSASGYGSKIIDEDKFQKLENPEKEKYLKIVKSGDIKRYEIKWLGEYVPKDVYPSSQIELFERPKIVISRQSLNIEAAFDCGGEYALGKVAFVHNFIEKISPYYLLSFLNSKLADFYFKKVYETLHMSGDYIRFDIPYLYNLPILTNLEKEKESIIIENVKKILLLKKLRSQFRKHWREESQQLKNEERTLEELFSESKRYIQRDNFEKAWIIDSNDFGLLENEVLLNKEYAKFKITAIERDILQISGISGHEEEFLLKLTMNSSELRDIIYLEILNLIDSRKKLKSLNHLFSKVSIPVIQPNTAQNTPNLLRKAKKQFKEWFDKNRTKLISCFEVESAKWIKNASKKFLDDFTGIDKEIQDIDHFLDAYIFKIFDFSEKEIHYVLKSLGVLDSDINDILSKFGSI